MPQDSNDTRYNVQGEIVQPGMPQPRRYTATLAANYSGANEEVERNFKLIEVTNRSLDTLPTLLQPRLKIDREDVCDPLTGKPMKVSIQFKGLSGTWGSQLVRDVPELRSAVALLTELRELKREISRDKVRRKSFLSLLKDRSSVSRLMGELSKEKN